MSLAPASDPGHAGLHPELEEARMIATARPMARLPAILFCGIVLFGSSPRGGARPAEDARQGERQGERQAERLGRGLVALRTSERSVFLSWRLLPSDPEGIGFALDRTVEGTSVGFRIHGEPVVTATSFEEKVPSGDLLDRGVRYDLRPVVGGRVGPAIASVTLPPRAPVRPYLSVPLETPDGYHPNDASVGDLDGDGEYEIVIHQVGRGRDNSQRGTTTNPILEAYRLDGTRLWGIDLGRNIREGAHYTQFLVWDFDGDGRAEVATKTADGTIDGAGNAMGDPDADWRNRDGYILDGPEFLTIFDGRSGKALSTVDYVPPRGDVASWGDDYGNRVDRFLACVAYLDGKRPSLVFCRGYYTRAVLAAFDFRDGKLEHRWTFDSDAGDEANRAYRGQGNHNIAVGDVDGDGRDEIVYGSCVIDDDGAGLYSTGLGHGDAMHLSDIDPDRPG
ncbi:MAG TPA: hypothetical protein VK116_07505, partial [Planctomycetota bacterium]|nr:hypothetical protein [Planctomycetota bacterium]